MSTRDNSQENNIVLCRLAIERCRMYAAHVCAIIHLCGGADGVAQDSLVGLMSRMEEELAASAEALLSS